MDLQELKKKINETGFSAEVLAKLNEIVDAAITKGSLDPAEKQQIAGLVDLDIEAGTIEADAMEEMALALDSYAATSEKILEMNDAAEAQIEADVDEGLNQIEGAAKETTPPAAPTL